MTDTALKHHGDEVLDDSCNYYTLYRRILPLTDEIHCRKVTLEPSVPCLLSGWRAVVANITRNSGMKGLSFYYSR